MPSRVNEGYNLRKQDITNSNIKRILIIDKSFNEHEIIKGISSMSRKDEKKVDRQLDSLTDSTISKLFEEKNFAFLATLMKDGSPQVTPTWVDLDKNHNTILINTAIGRAKHRNVSKDPRVALSIIDALNPYHMVAVRGKVIEQIDGKEADEHIDKMAK